MNKKNWKLFIVMLFCQLAFTASQAQDLLTVRGQVLDANSAPLPGVSVKIRNNKTTVSTDANGNYSLKVPIAGNHTLEFSYIGFETRALQLSSGRTVYNVQMVATSADLEEIVVVGYGTSRKVDLTGSVGSVKVADLEKAPVASFDQALAGRVAGVQVSASDGQPGDGLNIVVRGNNSVSQSNAPLYVVDGFPIETSVNTLLNPSEIESIEVLKDASATAIYGARGANGVIMITTKKGVKGEPKVTYQGFLGLQNEVKRMDMMSPYEFVKYELEFDSSRYTPIYLADGKSLESYRGVQGVDWQEQLFRTAPIQNHSIAIRGGTDRTKYSVSGSLLDQDGVIMNGGFNRYQGRVVLDQELGKRAKAGVNVNYSSSKSYGTQVGAAQGSPTSTLMYSIWGYRPITGSVSGDDDLLNEPYDPDVDPNTDLRFNPLLTANNTFNPQVNNTVLANAYVEYSVLNNLRLRVTGGLTRSQVNTQKFYNSKTQSGNPINSINGINGSISNSIRSNYLNENTLTYKPTLGKDHSLSVLGGFMVQKINYESSGFTAIQIPNEVLGMSGIDEGIISRSASELTSNALASVLGRVNYDYRSKYLLTASFRSDGSSKFSDGNKWSYFPSASVAWRLINEPFMKSIGFLSDAKLRGGYGQTGNNRVSDFAYLSSYQISAASGYTFNNAPLQGIIPDALGTRDLKWETTEQTDIGVDLAFLKNRIVFTADFYYKKTRDLLLNASLAPSMGYLKGLKNIGKVSNQGWEFSLDTRNVETKKFKWSSSFNISFNKNKVLQLSGEQPNLQTSITWGNFSSAPYIAIPGSPIALFNGYVFEGVYQYSDFNQLPNGSYELKAEVPNNGQPRTAIKPGSVKYKDVNGDGEVNADDITVIGDPNPIHIGGFSNNFTYGNFDLNVFFQWSYGNELMNVNRIVFEGGDARNFLNMFSSFEERWTPENPSNLMYSAVGAGPRVYSSRVVEDGSYLRLKTLALGYTVPSKALHAVGIKNLRVYASGQNLITWTKYTGSDPEVSVRQSALTPGFDLSPYPQMRTITFGLNLTL